MDGMIFLVNCSDGLDCVWWAAALVAISPKFIHVATTCLATENRTEC